MYKSNNKIIINLLFLFSLLICNIYFSKPTNIHNDSFLIKLAQQTRLIDNRTYINTTKKDNIKSKLEKYITCLATNIYFEARGEPLLGQIAVARVVMNRIKSSLYPNNACDVVYQKTISNNKVVCQFSWVCKNLPKPIKNSKSYIIATDIAKSVLIHDKWNTVINKNILNFHSIDVNPNWQLTHAMTIGNHKFFQIEK